MHAGQIVIVYEDLSNESSRDHYRAHWTASLDSDSCVTVYGYCDSSRRGSHTTIAACVAEVLKDYPHAEVWRYYPPLRYGQKASVRLHPKEN